MKSISIPYLAAWIALLAGCGPKFTEPGSWPGSLPGRWTFEHNGGIGGMAQPSTILYDFQASGALRYESTWGGYPSGSWTGKWSLTKDVLTATMDSCVGDESIKKDCPLSYEQAVYWDPGKKRVYTLVATGGNLLHKYFTYQR